LLCFCRVFQGHAAEDFGGEIGEACDGRLCAFRQSIADAERAVVGDADDVAGEGFVRNFAFAGWGIQAGWHLMLISRRNFDMSQLTMM
jgi:hypothetical protein